MVDEKKDLTSLTVYDFLGDYSSLVKVTEGNAIRLTHNGDSITLKLLDGVISAKFSNTISESVIDQNNVIVKSIPHTKKIYELTPENPTKVIQLTGEYTEDKKNWIGQIENTWFHNIDYTITLDSYVTADNKTYFGKPADTPTKDTFNTTWIWIIVAIIATGIGLYLVYLYLKSRQKNNTPAPATNPAPAPSITVVK